MRLISAHLQLVVLPEMLIVLLIRSLTESSSVVWRAVLEMCRREVWSRVGKRAGGHVVLVVAIAALTTDAAVLLMLAVHMVRVVPMTVALEGLVHVHLEALMGRTAVEQAMILPMAAVVVHAVRVMRRGVRARRSIG